MAWSPVEPGRRSGKPKAYRRSFLMGSDARSATTDLPAASNQPRNSSSVRALGRRFSSVDQAASSGSKICAAEGVNSIRQDTRLSCASFEGFPGNTPGISERAIGGFVVEPILQFAMGAAVGDETTKEVLPHVVQRNFRRGLRRGHSPSVV